MQRLLIFLVTTVLTLGLLQGQDKSKAAAIEGLANDYLSGKNTYGLSIATLEEGQVKYYNFGKQSSALDNPPSQNSLYEIASMTKTMTATALARMVYDDKVNYNDPISKFLPKEVVNWSPEERITLMDLVTHQSGLPRLPGNLFLTTKDITNPYSNYFEKDLYAFLTYYTPTELSKRKVDYSNLGFGLLGHLLAKVDSLSFEEMLTQRVLQSQTEGIATVELTGQAKELMLQGHQDGNETSLWDLPVLGGAGAVRANTEYMIHYLKAQIENPFYASLHKAIIGRQGMAWISSKLESGEKFVWHNGGTYGFASFGAFSKEEKVAVIVLSNAGIPVDDLGIKILKTLIKE